jgi:hypothetical protein
MLFVILSRAPQARVSKDAQTFRGGVVLERKL